MGTARTRFRSRTSSSNSSSNNNNTCNNMTITKTKTLSSAFLSRQLVRQYQLQLLHLMTTMMMRLKLKLSGYRHNEVSVHLQPRCCCCSFSTSSSLKWKSVCHGYGQKLYVYCLHSLHCIVLWCPFKRKHFGVLGHGFAKRAEEKKSKSVDHLFKYAAKRTTFNIQNIHMQQLQQTPKTITTAKATYKNCTFNNSIYLHNQTTKRQTTAGCDGMEGATYTLDTTYETVIHFEALQKSALTEIKL